MKQSCSIRLQRHSCSQCSPSTEVSFTSSHLVFCFVIVFQGSNLRNMIDIHEGNHLFLSEKSIISFPREGKEAELALTTTAGRERSLQINKLLHYSCAFSSMGLIYIRSIFLFEAVSALKSCFFSLCILVSAFLLKQFRL